MYLRKYNEEQKVYISKPKIKRPITILATERDIYGEEGFVVLDDFVVISGSVFGSTDMPGEVAAYLTIKAKEFEDMPDILSYENTGVSG